MTNHVAFELGTVQKSQIQIIEHENNTLKYQVAELQNQLHQERQMQQMLIQELEESKQLMQQSAQMQRDLLTQQQQLQTQLQQQNLSIQPNFAFTATAMPDQVNQTLQIIEKSHNSDLQIVIHQQNLQIQNLEAQIQRDKDKQMAQQQQINLLQFQLQSKNETINSLAVIQNELQEKMKSKDPNYTGFIEQSGQMTQIPANNSYTDQKLRLLHQQEAQKWAKRVDDQAAEIQRLQKQLDDQQYQYKQYQFKIQQEYNQMMLQNQEMRQQHDNQGNAVQQLQEECNILRSENQKLMSEVQNLQTQPRSVEHVPNSKRQQGQEHETPTQQKRTQQTEQVLNNISTLVQQSRLQEWEMQGMEYNSQENQSQPSSSTPQTAQKQDIIQVKSQEEQVNQNGLFDNLFLDRNDKRVQSIQFDEGNKTPTDNVMPQIQKSPSNSNKQPGAPKKQLSPIESLQQKNTKSPSPMRGKRVNPLQENNITYQKCHVSQLNCMNEWMDIEESPKQKGALITEINGMGSSNDYNIGDQQTLPINPPPVNRQDKLAVVKNAIVNNKQAEMKQQELQFEEDFGIDDLNH